MTAHNLEPAKKLNLKIRILEDLRGRLYRDYLSLRFKTVDKTGHWAVDSSLAGPESFRIIVNVFKK